MPASSLRPLLAPRSVALIGASDREGSLGRVVLHNLLEAGLRGELRLVNPNRERLADRPVYPDVAQLPETPELAVIVTPAPTVPGLIAQCGARGIAGAIVISAGFREVGPEGEERERAMLEAARQHGVRILGPNCLGLIRTDVGLNATFSAGQAHPGHIAVVSQSGALCTAILDWARTRDVGFSSLISTGVSADLDFGEILDWLVEDPATDSIMLYVEGVQDARRFVSALRAAARVKPVVVMKVGRHAEGSRAARSHTGALVGADDVFDAALRRAGVLRVVDFADFFNAAAMLDVGLRTRGDRLAIVTNAGGPGVLAADHCTDRGIPLAELSDTTIAALDGELPDAWSRGNPVDVLGDAAPERYAAAVRHCLADAGVDGVLAILTPQAQTRPEEVARHMVELAAGTRKPLLTCWMGDPAVASSRALFRTEDLPTFGTPESAVDAFAQVCAYRENQQQLLQVPEPLGPHAPPDVDGARHIVDRALADGREVLSLAESKALLAAFRIPILRSIPAHNPEDAVLIAQETGFPVALKIDSPDITHKSDAGGVRLGLEHAHEVHDAWHRMLEDVRRARPDARIDGVFVEPMWSGQAGRELMIGVVADPLFGPAISFGLGGTLVEVLDDRVVALPPLNRFLIHSMIGRSRAARLLAAFRGTPAVATEPLEEILLRVSELVCELPWLSALDLNPVIVDERGATVVDARVMVRPWNPSARPYDHMAIHPYPANLVEHVVLPHGQAVTIRPIRPEDAQMEQAFVAGLSERSRYLRFMSAFPKLPPQLLSRFTQIDYDREMALVAVVREGEAEREIGVARYASTDDGESCEFAIVVADAWQGRGLARRLFGKLIDTARSRRFRRMHGIILRENPRMLAFVHSMGFRTRPVPGEPEILRATMEL